MGKNDDQLVAGRLGDALQSAGRRHAPTFFEPMHSSEWVIVMIPGHYLDFRRTELESDYESGGRLHAVQRYGGLSIPQAAR
jgi:hypothetical protein